MPLNAQHPSNPSVHSRALFRQLDRFAMALAHRALRRERALVDDPRGEWRWSLRSLAWAFVVVVLYVSWGFTAPDSPLHLAAQVLVGAYIGGAIFNGLLRARAYKNGWLDGRRAMVGSMVEAQHRGLSLYEWLEGEAERDLVTALGSARLVQRRTGDEGDESEDE